MKQLLCVGILLFQLAASSSATPITFMAGGPAAPGLSGLNENPSNGSAASGSAVVTFDPVSHLMTVDVVFAGLTGTTTASHIHCCVAPPNNAGVATTTPTFTGFPGGVSAGTYSHTFDMTDPASYNPSFVTAHGGVAGAEAFLFAGMSAGQSYLNIHTTFRPGGEIRGFLTEVPEPGTIALGSVGFALILAGWLRRRATTTPK